MARLSFVFVLFLASTAAAQGQGSKTIALTLQAPKASSRPLKHTLLVPLAEQRAGNAIADYKEAAKKYKQLREEQGNREYDQKSEGWSTAALQDLPRKEMAEFFKKHQEVFALIESGARRDHADWEQLEGLRKRGIEAVIGGDYLPLRGLITLLSVRIRVYLAEGKIELALKDLQTGFTMARHLAEAPSLIGFLVGAASAGIMEERLEEVLCQPNVPNLYWALSDLPTPFLSLRKPMQGERLFKYAGFPGMLEAATNSEAGPLTKDQIEGCFKMAIGLQRDEPFIDAEAKADEAKLALSIQKKHEAAKRALIADGRPKDKVEAMPHVQVAVLHALLQSDQVFDEIQLAQQLAPWEGWLKVHDMVKKARDGFYTKGDEAPAIPLAKNVPASVEPMYRAQIRIDRRLAALHCVEALRRYAMAHDGKWPASLKDIKDVPVPIDPRTGKDFEYGVQDDKAFLLCPALGSETNTYPFAFAYELTYKR